MPASAGFSAALMALFKYVIWLSARRRAQELCESRGGRPGLPVPNKPTVSVDERKATLQPTKLPARVGRGRLSESCHLVMVVVGREGGRAEEEEW